MRYLITDHPGKTAIPTESLEPQTTVVFVDEEKGAQGE